MARHEERRWQIVIAHQTASDQTNRFWKYHPSLGIFEMERKWPKKWHQHWHLMSALWKSIGWPMGVYSQICEIQYKCDFKRDPTGFWRHCYWPGKRRCVANFFFLLCFSFCSLVNHVAESNWSCGVHAPLYLITWWIAFKGESVFHAPTTSLPLHSFGTHRAHDGPILNPKQHPLSPLRLCSVVSVKVCLTLQTSEKCTIWKDCNERHHNAWKITITGTWHF